MTKVRKILAISERKLAKKLTLADKVKVGDIGFVYASPNSIILSVIAYHTQGYYSHCFQVISKNKGEIFIGESVFPCGIRIIDIEESLRDRIVDIYRPIDKLNNRAMVRWWVENQGKKYDWLYYIGYILKKFNIQNSQAYTCNEAVIEACYAGGVKLSGNSPVALSKDRQLEYISTIVV